jgi:hypothetical protein
MKAIKRASSMTMVILFWFFAVTGVQAAIIWDDFSFRYAVEENSVDVYDVIVNRFHPAAELQGLTLRKTNTGGETDPVNSRVDSSTPTDPTGLGLQFNAGVG